MTDIEPRTEAGRALLLNLTRNPVSGKLLGIVFPADILAIEAEAAVTLDEDRLALAILTAGLLIEDSIPPNRWDLYAGTIADKLAAEYARLSRTEPAKETP